MHWTATSLTASPPGDFLMAVLSNDLMESIGRADQGNLGDLFEICSYIYNKMPYNCHGSPNRVHEWLAKHQEDRRERERKAQEATEEENNEKARTP